MPIYEYQCNSCGPFAALRRMSEFELPTICDSCGESAARIISAPRLAVIEKSSRVAHERNEKSAHEPSFSRRSSCGCSGRHHCKSTSEKSVSNSKTEKGGPLQMQTKKSARPWMLGP